MMGYSYTYWYTLFIISTHTVHCTLLYKLYQWRIFLRYVILGLWYCCDVVLLFLSFFLFFNVLLNLSLLSHYFALFYYIFGNYLWMSIFVWNIQPITQHKFNAHKCINKYISTYVICYFLSLFSLSTYYT